MNSWLIFAIVAPILWAFSNVIDATIRKSYVKDDVAMTWYLTISRLPLVIALFLIFGFEVPSIQIFILMLVAGAFWITPFVFYYKAMEFEEPSRVALLLQIVPIFTLAIAYLTIHETLTTQQLVAFLILLTAGGLAALKKLEGVWRFSKAFWLIGLASVLWAATDVMFKKFQADFSGFLPAFTVYLLGSSLPALFLPVVFKKRNLAQHFRGLPSRAWIFLGINVLIGIGGSVAFAYALSLGAASLTAVIIGIQPLFVFIFGLILAGLFREIYKEDLSGRSLALKGASFALVLAGLFLLQ